MLPRFIVYSVLVHCRIGSLESIKHRICRVYNVHCRIGSLETLDLTEDEAEKSLLPSRQFRKKTIRFKKHSNGLLPSRQFRNSTRKGDFLIIS